MNEAADALMATLGEYDVLWDGTLSPEIIDAELYDCSGPIRSTIRLPVELCMTFDSHLTQQFDRMDALVTLMATLGEYDALWDGTLTPEIVDAELYDCPQEDPWNTILPPPLCFRDDPRLIQMADRYEAMLSLIEVVKCYVIMCLDTWRISEEVHGRMYDCPYDNLIFESIEQSPQDWPSVESLK